MKINRSASIYGLAACSLLAFVVGAWWLGGTDVCAGYMATYDLASASCIGGKLLGKSYSPTVSEQLAAALENGLIYGAILGVLIAIVVFRKFLQGARSHLKGNKF
jgi:hypothetical protein